MSLRRQTLWSMLPILVTSVISIVSVPLYFRVLGEQMYAMWFYVSTLTGAFGFMDLGLSVTAGRYIGVAMGAKDQVAIRQYWATSHALVLPIIAFFTLVFICIGTLFGPIWFKVSGPEAQALRWAMTLGGLCLFFNYYGQMWYVLAAAHLDFRFLSLLRSTLGIVSSLGALGVALLFKSTPALLAYSALLGFLQFCFLIHRGNTRYALPVCFADCRLARLKEMLPYTIKTFLSLVSGSVLGSVDRVLLGRFAPAGAFAAYNVALNIGMRAQNLSQAAMGPIFCNTSLGVGGDSDRSPKTVYKESWQFLFPWYGLMIVWSAVWHEPVVMFWLKENAALTAQAFPWIMAGCCLAALSNISGAQLGPLNKVGIGLFFSLLTSCLSALFVVLGWHFHGIAGAAAGFFLARVSLVFQDLLVRKKSGFGYSLNDIKLFAVQGLFLLFCGSLYWIAKSVALPLAPTVLLAFFSGAICAACLLFSNLRKKTS